MFLLINGDKIEFESKKNIQQILENFKIETKVIAISLNNQIVKKEDYSNTIPNNGDKIEFLQFMGGG